MHKVARTLGYGIGDFGLNIYWKTVSLYLLFWYTTIIGLDPKVAGMLVFIGMTWDAISDPIMASLSERVNTRFGTYRPFLLFGPFILLFSFSFLFWKPPFSGNFLILTLIFMALIFRTSYTIVAVPYSALTSRLSYDSVERTHLSGSRMFFAFLGLLAVSMFLPQLIEHYTVKFGSEAKAFQRAAFIGSLFATLTILLCFLSTKEQPLPEKTVKFEKQWAAIYKNVTTNKALRILLFIIILNTTASSSIIMTMIFFIEANQHKLASKETVLTAYAIGTLAFVPLWTVLIHYLGRKRVWITVTLVFVITAIHMYFFSTYIIQGIPVQIVIFGILSGAYAIIFWAFVPDCVEYGQADNGYRSEASTYGSVLIVQKLSGGIMGLFIGFVLSSYGITSDNLAQLKENGENLTLFLAICPAILLSLSIPFLLALPLDRNSHSMIVNNLNSEDMSNG